MRAEVLVTFTDNTTDLRTVETEYQFGVRNRVLIVGTKLDSSGAANTQIETISRTMCDNAKRLFELCGFTVVPGDPLLRSKSNVLAESPHFTAIFAATHGNTGVFTSSLNEIITWSELEAVRGGALFHTGLLYTCNAFQALPAVEAAQNRTLISQALGGFQHATSHVLAMNGNQVNNDPVRVPAPPPGSSAASISNHVRHLMNLLHLGEAFASAVAKSNAAYLPRTQVEVEGVYYLDPNPMQFSGAASGATKLRNVFLTYAEAAALADAGVAIDETTLVYNSWYLLF